MPKSILFEGALVVDDRGEVGFANDFNFSGIKQFYTIKKTIGRGLSMPGMRIGVNPNTLL